MITTLKWIPRGSNQRQPKKADCDEAQLNEFKALAEQQFNIAKEDLDRRQNEQNNIDEEVDMDKVPELSNEQEELEDEEDEEELVREVKDENDLSIYNLDDYDNETADVSVFGNLEEMLDTHNLGPNEDDSVIQELNELENQQEEEDLLIEPEDCLLLSGKTENDLSQVELYIYEESEQNIYVHHDILLPSFPLCLEWMNFTPNSGNQGSFVAIGTLEPEIEIWDLDVVDAFYPSMILGNTNGKDRSTVQSKNKSKLQQHNFNKPKGIHAEYHTDAIMSLNWNRNYRHLLASSSADTTIKIWDLTNGQCFRSFDLHSDKVQSIQWHPSEATILLSGSYDHTVKIFDSRSPDTATNFKVATDVEKVQWDVFDPNQCYVALDNGVVLSLDVRQTNAPLFTLHAHDKAVSAMDLNPHIPGCLVTGSVDKLIKVWNLKSQQPSMVLSRNFDLGQVFSLSFNMDVPYHLAMAGSKGVAKVWDISSNLGFRASFEASGYTFLNEHGGEAQPVCLQDDKESDEED